MATLHMPDNSAMARAHAAIIVGDDARGVASRLGDLPVLQARLIPGAEAGALRGRRVVAFAGIGDPRGIAIRSAKHAERKILDGEIGGRLVGAVHP